MNGERLEDKTKRFALAAVEAVESLPRGKSTDFLGRELLQAATSVGTAYRAARRARSRSEFIEKLERTELHADAAAYWLELLSDSGACKRMSTEGLRRLQSLREEADALLAMTFASIKTAKQRKE